jgi:phage terminase large subunit-like protein
MGELQAGDEIFDEGGDICLVVEVHEITMEKDAWRIIFSDGSTVDACGEHLWLTETKALRKNRGRSRNINASEVVTTKQISKSLKIYNREINHSIPCASPLNLPDSDLPISPYIFGYWLGDGSSKNFDITCGDEDFSSFKFQVRRAGYIIKKARRKNGARCATYPVSNGKRYQHNSNGNACPNGSLQSLIQLLGVRENKHIPNVYLRSSVNQRFELLAGLLDSDGSCCRRSGRIEFSSKHKLLAENVAELACSLGLKVTINQGLAKLYGKLCGIRYRVSFTAYSRVFKLDRKAKRQRTPGAQQLRQRRRYITAVEPIKPCLMRCITVDSPSNLYLCGKSFIATHNTRSAAEEVWWQAYTNPGWRIGVIAPTNNDTEKVCVEGKSGLLACCPPELIAKYTKKPVEITFTNGSIIFGYSSDVPDRLRGPEHNMIWGEEISSWAYPQATWDMAQFGLRIGERPRQIITSTPKPIQLVRNIIADPHTITIHSSTYANRDNLAASFFDEIIKYEGTDLGRQEIYGEVLDLSMTAVFKKSWWKWWPHNKPLPQFDLIIQSYDTAFSEKETADDTACTVWGLFKATEGKPEYSALLLDCWDDKIGFPDLRKRVIAEFSTKYGTNDKTADAVLVENKGSGISLIQELRRAQIPVYGFDPGGADKLQRAHLVSHIVAGGYVWIPQTRRSGHGGIPLDQPCDWAKKWYDQLSYFGPDTLEDGSKKDYVDSTTAFLSFMSKCGWMKTSGMPEQPTYWQRQSKRVIYG